MTDLNPGDIIQIRGQIAIRDGHYLIVAVGQPGIYENCAWFDVRQIHDGGRLDHKRMAYLQLNTVRVVRGKPKVTPAQMREGRHIRRALSGAGPARIPTQRQPSDPITRRAS